jgi:hypothetical protein
LMSRQQLLLDVRSCSDRKNEHRRSPTTTYSRGGRRPETPERPLSPVAAPRDGSRPEWQEQQARRGPDASRVLAQFSHVSGSDRGRMSFGGPRRSRSVENLWNRRGRPVRGLSRSVFRHPAEPPASLAWRFAPSSLARRRAIVTIAEAE